MNTKINIDIVFENEYTGSTDYLYVNLICNVIENFDSVSSYSEFIANDKPKKASYDYYGIEEDSIRIENSNEYSLHEFDVINNYIEDNFEEIKNKFLIQHLNDNNGCDY